uniref:uncharacterized protein LOC120334141 n=1 Tax=Styela clava TaxID=7725 RepID=UPI00193A1A9B|nr:uncharacterized protein LOC120334141 [Styela clava]
MKQNYENMEKCDVMFYTDLFFIGLWMSIVVYYSVTETTWSKVWERPRNTEIYRNPIRKPLELSIAWMNTQAWGLNNTIQRQRLSVHWAACVTDDSFKCLKTKD